MESVLICRVSFSFPWRCVTLHFPRKKVSIQFQKNMRVMTVPVVSTNSNQAEHQIGESAKDFECVSYFISSSLSLTSNGHSAWKMQMSLTEHKQSAAHLWWREKIPSIFQTCRAKQLCSQWLSILFFNPHKLREIGRLRFMSFFLHWWIIREQKAKGDKSGRGCGSCRRPFNGIIQANNPNSPLWSFIRNLAVLDKVDKLDDDTEVGYAQLKVTSASKMLSFSLSVFGSYGSWARHHVFTLFICMDWRI